MSNNFYFETIKCNDYEVFNLEYHQKRISDTIGLNFNLNEYIYPPNSNLLKCKVIYNNDEIISIEYDNYIKKVINKFKLIYDNKITYNKKLINREALNNLYLKKEDADEIIIVKNNLVSDTSIANIAIFYENEWLSPKSYLLKGTTLSRYISNGLLKQKDITVDMLRNAKKIALLNAMIDFDIINKYTIKE